MLAQLINFTIVAWVLWRYALKPLTAVMTKRADEIEKGLSDAKKAEEALVQVREIKEETLREAKKQAEEIKKEAEVQAEKQRQETLARVKTEAERVLQETREKFLVEKDQILQDVKRQAASLVVQATGKVLGKISTPKLDHDLVEQAVKDTINKPKAK
jgi:F-type H+-transporting ATPase subunit b